MSKALFISENTLIENSVISENVSYTQLRPTIVKVQEMHIQPAVGSALYAELVAQVIAGTLSANNTTLMQTYIQPAIIQWMYFELPMVLAFKFMNKGMDRRSSTESSPMSEREMTRLMDKSRDDAEWYTERITRYLQENHTLFPLFDNPPVAIDTIYPANSAYQTGMVLGRRGRYRDPLDYPENRRNYF